MTEQQAQRWEKPIMLCKEELSFAHGDPMYCDHRINLVHSLSRFNGFACMWCWMLVPWHGEVKRETSHLFQYFCRRSLLTWWHAALIWIQNAIYKLTTRFRKYTFREVHLWQLVIHPQKLWDIKIHPEIGAWRSWSLRNQWKNPYITKIATGKGWKIWNHLSGLGCLHCIYGDEILPN